MRVKNEDLSGAVYSPNSKEKESVVDHNPVTEVVFTLRGQHDYMYQDMPAVYNQGQTKAENRKDACAKKVGHRYFLKVNSRGDIYNPLDPNHLSNANKQENNIPIWQYKPVAYTTFCHYMHFLKTRNQNFLIYARRDLGSNL